MRLCQCFTPKDNTQIMRSTINSILFKGVLLWEKQTHHQRLR